MSDPNDILAKLQQGIAVPQGDLPMEATPNERRCYALLQAAATMTAGHWPYVQPVALIDTAIELLAEIERREPQ